jgi:hypothetical protein
MFISFLQNKAFKLDQTAFFLSDFVGVVRVTGALRWDKHITLHIAYTYRELNQRQLPQDCNCIDKNKNAEKKVALI